MVSEMTADKVKGMLFCRKMISSCLEAGVAKRCREGPAAALQAGRGPFIPPGDAED